MPTKITFCPKCLSTDISSDSNSLPGSQMFDFGMQRCNSCGNSARIFPVIDIEEYEELLKASKKSDKDDTSTNFKYT